MDTREYKASHARHIRLPSHKETWRTAQFLSVDADELESDKITDISSRSVIEGFEVEGFEIDGEEVLGMDIADVSTAEKKKRQNARDGVVEEVLSRHLCELFVKVVQ